MGELHLFLLSNWPGPFHPCHHLAPNPYRANPDASPNLHVRVPPVARANFVGVAVEGVGLDSSHGLAEQTGGADCSHFGSHVWPSK